jgi:endonuclease G
VAIVMRENRPVVFVRDDSYDDFDDPWRSLNSVEVKTRLSALFPLIGRLEVPNSTLGPYVGACFVVGRELVATCRHAAQIFSQGLGLAIQYHAGDAAIDFKRRVDTPEDDRSAYFPVSGVEMIHPYWDMALLRVDGMPTDRMLRLSVRSPGDLIGRNIVVVGYPARDQRNDLELQEKIFGGVYYVKRLQPGVVRGRAEVQSFGNRVAAMTHDASTLGGSGGSPIIDVDTGEVVALTFAGEYLNANYAVPMFELARDPRVAPRLNFDGVVAATSDFDPAWRSINATVEPERLDTIRSGVEKPADNRPHTVESGLEKLAESGLEKLAYNRHHDITPSEMFGLEAIVMKANRPIVFVRGNSYDDVGAPWSDLNAAEVKTRLSALFPLIGRIELPTSPIIPYPGTGFVGGKGLVATSRAVAQIFSRGLGLTVGYRAGDAAIDFKREVDIREDDRSTYFAVSGVEMIHPYWDMALLRVDGLPTDKMLRLSVRSPDELADRRIVVVGYPAFDPRSDAVLQDKILGGVYNVKRLQPGIIRARAEVQSFENRVAAVTHDASTLGCNAGAPIIDIETGEVVALHFAGAYLRANYAVPMFELARDARIASKLNFEGAVAATSDFDPAWRSINTAIGAERSVKPKYYVSYAWADPTDPDREKIVDQACEEAQRRGITIIRDKTTLKVGDSVSKFMTQIAQGDVIFVVVSDKYLKSPFCMFELFEIWRVNRQDETEFLQRVKIYVLQDAKISTPSDRLRYAGFWRQEHDQLKSAMDAAGLDVVGEADLRLYKQMQEYYNKVSDILALFASILQPRSFDDLKAYGFDEPAKAGVA